MTKYRLLHIPSGQFTDIALKAVLDDVCGTVKCPKNEHGEIDCESCAWDTSRDYLDNEYLLEEIKDD